MRVCQCTAAAFSNSKRAAKGFFSRGDFTNYLKHDSRWGWRFWRRFCRVLGRFARCFRTLVRGGAAISLWRISVCRPSPCFSCRARLFCPFSGSWRKARDGRTAKPCSGSRRSLPTIISGTCSTVRTPGCSRPAFNARSNCSLSPRCARRSAGSAAERSSPSTGPSISAARRSPARIARRASAATARSRAIIPCCARRLSRRDIPRSSRSRRSPDLIRGSSSNRMAPRSRTASATRSSAGSTSTARA